MADPGFLLGGGTNSPGAPTYDFAKFSQKLHEIKEFGPGGRVPRAPLDPPLKTHTVFYFWSTCALTFVVVPHT